MSIEIHKPNPSEITLTDEAAAYVQSFLAKNGNNKGLRFGLKKGGCSGLSYIIEPVSDTDTNDLVFPIQNSQNLAVYVANKHFPYLQGTQLDYLIEGLNARLIFKNPNEKNACGCGESFNTD